MHVLAPERQGIKGDVTHDENRDETRSGEEAIDEIREKREDEELAPGEREFLESERVRLDPEHGSGAPIA